ncbi:TPA: hypothetical protein ACOTGY_001369 [Clostridium perfringens]
MDSKKEFKKRLWFYEMFLIIFAIIGILKSLGLYDINDNIINSFTIGTFLFTISDLLEKEKFKNIFLLLGMFAIVALPNCNYILNIINKFIKQDVLMLFSLCLVFFSLTINEQKSFYNERKEGILDKLLETNTKQEEMLQEQTKLLKNQNKENIEGLIETWTSVKSLVAFNIDSLNKILEDKEINKDSKDCINNIIYNNKIKIKAIDGMLIKFKEALESKK